MNVDHSPVESRQEENLGYKRAEVTHIASLEEDLVMALNSLNTSTNNSSAPPPLVTLPSKDLKRGLSPESSVENPTNPTSARQICIDGTMYELIDLTNDEVRFYGCIHSNFIMPNLNRWKCHSDLYSAVKPRNHASKAYRVSYTMRLEIPSPMYHRFM